MASAIRKYSHFVSISLASLAAFAPSAHAAITSDVTIQVLDQLDVFGSANLKRSTESPVNFVDLNSVATTTLKSCQNGRLGLTCLDGQLARNWPVPKTLTAPPTSSNKDSGKVLFSCEDDALALDVKGGACTSLTVDVKGHVWIAARKSSNSHNLIELIRKAGTSCNTTTEGNPLSGKVKGVTLSNTDSAEYCYNIRRTGRPLLLDISAFDGELASSYRGPGILGVESRKTVVFFPSDGSAVVEIGAGKNDWNLLGGEQVYSAALLQREDPATPSIVYTYGLITTSTGRVMWKNMADTLVAKQVANVNSTVSSFTIDASTGVASFPRGTTACETGSTANFFEIRASDTTGRLFFSNRNYCKLFVASPMFDGTTNGIATLSDPEIPPSLASPFKPEGISVSPGIAVDLAKCGVLGCDYIKDGTDFGGDNTYAAARMIDVTLAPNSPAGLIVFQIKNIPDCRYLTTPPPECTPETVKLVAGKGMYLNVTPMLPQQIKDLFDSSGKKPFGLPPMYISPRYKAQAQNDHYFDALFGVTDPKVVFRKSFTAQFDVGDSNLAGQKLGCGAFSKDGQGNLTGQAFQLWDITTVVSERFTSVGGPNNVVLDIQDDPSTPLVNEFYSGEHVDMLANKDCFNPTSGAGTRWSMYSFNLQLADGAAGYSYAAPRTYLGNLLYSLMDDLSDTQTRLACANVDAVGNDPFVAGAAPPLNSSTCSSLASSLLNARDKLNKCVIAATDPKTSALDQNCQAFDSQIKGYRSSVNSLTPTGADPANRVGELISRTDVIYHVFKDHFLNAPLSQ